MKLIYSLIAVITFAFAGFSQDGLYVKYETQIDASGEDGEMMAMMMNGSTMELAASEKKTWVKTQMGTMITMYMEYNMEDENMLMLMSGLAGTMAFEGNPDDLSEEEEEEEMPEFELTSETKTILSYECKKAMMKDDEGNTAIYWYTEDFARPEGMSQMPNQVPGLCLEMEILAEGDIKMTYTAIEVNEKVDMSEYEVVVPEGTSVQSLTELKSMGMGGM